MEEQLSIGAVAARSGLAVSAIRFYEARGLVVSARTIGNQRRYPRSVLRRLAFIRAAQSVGLSLDAVAEALATLPAGPVTRSDWSRLSRSWRPVLAERIATLERLRDQLDSCIGCGCLSLRRCALYNAGDGRARLGPGSDLVR